MLAYGIDFLNHVVSLVASIPIARTIYTLIVLLILLLLVRDLQSLWFQNTIVLGEFEYYDKGKINHDSASQVRSETVYYYKSFAETIAREVEARRITTFDPDENAGAELKRWVQSTDRFGTEKSMDLSSLELSFQGINLQKIVSYVAKLLARSQEVTGTIVKSEGATTVLLTYPSLPRRGQDNAPPRVDLGNISGDQEVAIRLACFLIWAQSDEGNDRFLGVGFDEFCDWMKATYLKQVAADTSDAYFTNKRYADNTSFARNYVRHAFEGGPGYSQAYLAAADLADLDADTPLTLNEGVSIRQEYLAPLLRYFYLRKFNARFGYERRGHDPEVRQFYKELRASNTLKVNSALDLAKLFFRKRVTEFCKDVDKANAGLRRHVALITIGGSARTGVIVGPGVVVTRATRKWLHGGGSATWQADVKVESQTCGGEMTAHAVENIHFAPVEEGEGVRKTTGSAWLALFVPSVGADLKMIDYNKQEDLQQLEREEIVSVGFSHDIERAVRYFGERTSTEAQNPPKASVLYKVRGQILSVGEERSPIMWRGPVLTNDAPMAPGMLGSAIFTGDGTLVGIQAWTLSSSGWLAVSKAVPIGAVLRALKLPAAGSQKQ